ncbi:serine protease [Azospirillum sp.]|uniref:serine protease n=1 Tax=Azospirillum sp. TaxID=34012 RepID=UPI00260494C8|nr:serine protease [Azospirillum sp.]
MLIPLSFARRPCGAMVRVIVAALPLAGCLTTTPPPRPDPAARVAPGSVEPLRFNGLSIDAMRRGMEIGRYVWDLDCAPPYDPVFWTSGVGMRRGSTIDARFGEVMADTGFDVVGRHGGPDAPGAGDNRARFTVQGELRDVRLELCHRNNWLTGASKGVSGSGSARVDWSVYDARDGRLVHRVATSGVSRQDSGVPQGDILLIEEAVAAAADRLAADPGFRAALRRGGPAVPPVGGGGLAAAAGETTGRVLAGPGLESPSDHPASTPTILTPAVERGGSDRMDARLGAARIRVGSGHGLVIGAVSRDGGWHSLLLAPQISPGDSVMVHPARGVELTGHVENWDAASGFALVRVPARLTAVAVRGAPLRVSDPVRVVMTRPGGENGKREAKGIVGGLPLDPQRGVAVIQADLGLADPLGERVEAGDALLDDSGALAGLALGPSGMATTAPPGLTAFLPVGGLLSRLGVDLRQERTDQDRSPDHDAELDGNGDPPT